MKTKNCIENKDLIQSILEKEGREQIASSLKQIDINIEDIVIQEGEEAINYPDDDPFDDYHSSMECHLRQIGEAGKNAR